MTSMAMRPQIKQVKEFLNMYKQNVGIDRKLNEINHDYQRMRKLAKRRISKKLGDPIPENKDHWGADAWVNVKHIKWYEVAVWLSVGYLIALWLH